MTDIQVKILETSKSLGWKFDTMVGETVRIVREIGDRKYKIYILYDGDIMHGE